MISLFNLQISRRSISNPVKTISYLEIFNSFIYSKSFEISIYSNLFPFINSPSIYLNKYSPTLGSTQNSETDKYYLHYKGIIFPLK